MTRYEIGGKKKRDVVTFYRLGQETTHVIATLIYAFKSVDFDIIIPRKLTDIDIKEQMIGAITEDGTT